MAEAVTAARTGKFPMHGVGLVLAISVVIAALVRIYWAMTHGLVVEQEGVEYTRIATNLLSGRGYVGIFNNGTQLNFPPLYPLLIAALTYLTGAPDLAARVLCIAFGAALVIPMFKIADRLYGRQVAIGVGALVVLHPVLIATAASTYSEGPYLTLMMSAMLCIIRWIDDRRLVQSVSAGALLGLAYLIRPEAFLFAGAAIVGGLLWSLVTSLRRQTWLGALALAGTFAMVAAPNVAFLTRNIGQWRIEAKGTLAYQWGSRMNAGMSYTEAANGIGQDLSEQGVFMRSNLAVIQSANYTFGEYVRFVLDAGRKNLTPILRTITAGPVFGSPWLFVLVFLGACRSIWTRQRAALEGVTWMAAAIFVAALLTVQALWFRYFISLLTMMLLWAGKGIDELGQWAGDSALAISCRAGVARFSGALVKWGALAIVVIISLHAIPFESQFSESQNWERRDAGRWLSQQPGAHKWVMDNSLQVAYYAKADLMYLPYGDSDLALRYVTRKRPDYIVLPGGGGGGLPYVRQWFDHGIPDQRATLVYDRAPLHAERVKIYKWNAAPLAVP